MWTHDRTRLKGCVLALVTISLLAAPGGMCAQAPYEDAVWHDAQRERDVPVRIYAPDLGNGDGPFPAIVFSHGGGESREAFGYLGSYWAEHGYIVVFLTHIGSDRAVVEGQGMRAMNGGGPENFHLRPEDVSFALDTLLSDDPGSELLRGRVDAGRVAVVGQCAGATTALAMVGLRADLPGRKDATFTDPRCKCAIALSPQPGGARGGSLNDKSWAGIEVPTLMVTGTRDFNWLPAVRANPRLVCMPYEGLPPGDKYLVEIKGAEHNAFTDSVPYYEARERDPRHHGWIQQATTAFLDAYLKGYGEKLEWLQKKTLAAETDGECMQDQKLAEAAGASSQKPTPTAQGNDARPEVPAQDRAGRLLLLLERDNDQALSVEESPDGLKAQFGRVDADGDGRLSREELVPVIERSEDLDGADADDGIPPWRWRRGVGDEAMDGIAPNVVSVVEDLAFHDAKSGHDLRLRVTYPKAVGQFPIILFSHCARGKRDDFQPLVAHWASHGYVVIQMDHSDEGGPGEGWRSRVADMTFVLDSLEAIGLKSPELSSRMDPARVGVGGHLIGAYAASALVGMKVFQDGETAPPITCADPRVDAALLLSPQGRGQGLTEKSWEEIDKPMLVAAGSEAPSLRTSNPPEWRAEPYHLAKPGNKYLLWIEGMDNSYEGLWRGGVEPEAAAFIQDVTTAFWDAHLKGDTQARERLQSWPVPETDQERFWIEGNPTPPAPTLDSRANVEDSPDPANCERAADYSARNGGRAVLVMVKGEIVFERYDNGFGADTGTNLRSATKGFWGPVIAAMIEDGLIESYDELASKTLPEWAGNPRKGRITLRDLLSLSAGLVQDMVNLQGDDRPTLAPDLYRHAIGVPAIQEPGAVFQYGPSCYYVLGEIMKRKLADRKQTPLDYLKQRILDPIGVETGDWVHDASGNPHIPNGAYLTARDWAKYGQWLLQVGEWNREQIVSGDLLAELVKPTDTNPGYGLSLWLNHPGGQGAASGQVAPPGSQGGFIYHHGCPDLFAALGAGKCRMYVIPSLEMVVVRQGDVQNDRYQDDIFLSLLLTGKAADALP